jgi:tryptophanase
MEIGSLSFGSKASMELVRFAIPRRVYTLDQLLHIVAVFKKIIKIKHKIKGCAILKAPNVLRHFSAHLELI